MIAVSGLRTMLGGAAIVDGVDFSIARGELLGLAGESGCGKSMLALSLLRLLPPGAVSTGRISCGGRELLSLSAAEMRAVRGGRIAMVFQEPMSSLHPTLRIEDQIIGALRAHAPATARRTLRDRARAALARARMPDVAVAARAYPHELSGGLCQRAMIAMAIAGEPELLIADEPTTALDATVAAEILDLLDALRRDGLAILLITHDLRLLARRADRIAVMYGGRIVEAAPAAALFAAAQHPYSRALLAAMPPLFGPLPERLAAIPGGVPAPGQWPTGCRFRNRCGAVVTRCSEIDPALTEVAPGHAAACLRAPFETDVVF